jgi:hypothetical protein
MKPLVLHPSSGKRQTIPNNQTLEVGSGITSTIGSGQNLTLSSDTDYIVVNSAKSLNLGTGISLSQNAIERQDVGNLSIATQDNTLTFNIGYDSLTWNIAGNLIPTQDLALNLGNDLSRLGEVHTTRLDLRQDTTNTLVSSLSATSMSVVNNFNFKVLNANALRLSTTACTVLSNFTLDTTGTGNINLPNNLSSRFKIEGVSVSAQVTAANLSNLTDGSFTDLHHHNSNQIKSATSGEIIPNGAPVGVENSGGVPRLFMANAASSGNRHFAIGFSTNTFLFNTSARYFIWGEIEVPDSRWVVPTTVSDIGSVVYLSTTMGKVTLTPPVAAGTYVQKLGIITSVGSSPGTTKVLIQPSHSILNS